MWVRFIVLLSLYFCHLEEVEAFPGMGGVAGFIVSNSVTALNLPGYMGLLTSKSTIMTYLLHKIAGQHFERRFAAIIKQAVDQMPDSAPIPDVKNDNVEKMTFLNGKISGLRTMQVTPNTNVEIVWGSRGILSAVASVQFKALKVTGDIKTKFFMKSVDGPLEVKFNENNFSLKLRLHPGPIEWCYLRMYDVILTDLEEAEWTVRDKNGDTDSMAGIAMKGYFTTTEGEVENHIKTTITNVLFYEIPKASPAICDNTKKTLRQSKYETFVKKKEHKQ